MLLLLCWLWEPACNTPISLIADLRRDPAGRAHTQQILEHRRYTSVLTSAFGLDTPELDSLDFFFALGMRRWIQYKHLTLRLSLLDQPIFSRTRLSTCTTDVARLLSRRRCTYPSSVLSARKHNTTPEFQHTTADISMGPLSPHLSSADFTRDRGPWSRICQTNKSPLNNISPPTLFPLSLEQLGSTLG